MTSNIEKTGATAFAGRCHGLQHFLCGAFGLRRPWRQLPRQVAQCRAAGSWDQGWYIWHIGYINGEYLFIYVHIYIYIFICGEYLWISMLNWIMVVYISIVSPCIIVYYRLSLIQVACFERYRPSNTVLLKSRAHLVTVREELVPLPLGQGIQCTCKQMESKMSKLF